MAPDLHARLADIELKSPLVLASGILGVTASSLAAVARAGAGAVTTKSFSLEPRLGHKGPTIISFGAGLVNAVGLSNPGWEGAVAEIRAYQALGVAPLFASVFGRTVDEFVAVAERAAEAAPNLIEVNVSCPNVASELGTPFETDMQALAAVARGVKRVAGAIPVSIKLSANYGFLERAAKIVAEEGVDAITAINTVGPGMVIDTHVRRPVLSNKMGGVSGPAILPVAVRAVYEIYRAVKLPIIGTGGVSTPDAALQMIMAGATAVGVGSAVYDHDLAVFGELNQGLQAFLEREGIASLAEPEERLMARDRAAMETCRVTRVIEHGPQLKSLYVPQTFDILPGQFVNLWLPGVDEKPFSVSDVVQGELELSIKAVGRFTEVAMGLKAGDWVGIRGPCGHGFALVQDGVLVGGGIGIAPLRFLARRLSEQGLRHRLLFGVKGRQDLIFPADYADAELWSDDGSLGSHGLVTQGLARLLDAEPPAVIYGAGPEPMLLAVRELARAHRVPVQLTFERYMKCGFGICGQCCLDGSGIRLCVDGPVLTEAQLAGVTELGQPHRLASGARPVSVGRH